ncbi:hypothetical protein, partial [Pseudomonas salomonii]|uniref:hypothetical protein n=1 Tax=Pseudomonas salomonii TaxID=191391 RepID=UPI001C7F1E4F
QSYRSMTREKPKRHDRRKSSVYKIQSAKPRAHRTAGLKTVSGFHKFAIFKTPGTLITHYHGGIVSLCFRSGASLHE